jgi:parvulin-like peptidyl-prolyl isomerase
MVPNNHLNDTHARRLLLAGAVLGVLLAAVGLLRSSHSAAGANVSTLPEGTVAMVNGYPIAQDLYARVLSGLAMEQKTPEPGPAERRRVLDRLIDEEILLQRGLELGLARVDQVIRRQIVAAVIASITAEAEEVIPDEAELRRFYKEHADFFVRSDRLSFAQILFRVSSATEDVLARQRAAEAAQRLRAGEPFAVVSKGLGDEPVMRLPSGPLPAEKIQEYLGPTLTRALRPLPQERRVIRCARG